MRTLIIYAGQTRAHKDVWANHAFHLVSKLPEPTIIVSVEKDDKTEDMRLLEKAFPCVPFFMETVVQPQIEEPKELCRWHAGNPRASTVQGILRQLWAWERAWLYAKAIVDVKAFDVVVRVRPDSAFLRCRLPELRFFGQSTCLTPWWDKWGGCNDRFALLGPRAAEAYFTTFSRRQALWAEWCPVHPETMLWESLWSQGIKPSPTLRVEFHKAKEGDDGKISAMNCSPIDMVDAATSLDPL